MAFIFYCELKHFDQESQEEIDIERRWIDIRSIPPKEEAVYRKIFPEPLQSYETIESRLCLMRICQLIEQNPKINRFYIFEAKKMECDRGISGFPIYATEENSVSGDQKSDMAANAIVFAAIIKEICKPA